MRRSGKVGQGDVVLPGHDQGVAGEQRADVEKADGDVVVEHHVRRPLPRDDLAEDAPRHGRTVGRHPRPRADPDHPPLRPPHAALMALVLLLRTPSNTNERRRVI